MYERLNLCCRKNAKSPFPLVTKHTLLLDADFFCNADHEAGLYLDYLVLSILSDHLIAVLLSDYLLFFLVGHGSWQRRLRFTPENVKVILGLPAAGANFKQVVCEGAPVLPSGHGGKIAKGSVYDGHLDLVRKEA